MIRQFADHHTFHFPYSTSLLEALHMIEDIHPLEHSLNEVFTSLHYNSYLLTSGMNTVAIMMSFTAAY